jgi:hypothetical protein
MFWCSGIHKDGWVLAFIGYAFLAAVRWQKTRKAYYLFYMITALLLLFTTRYFVFLCLLGPWLFWLILDQTKYKIRWFALLYGLMLLLVFSLGKISSIEPINLIIAKQQSFFSLRGYSDMQTPILENNFGSFVLNLPSALDHVFLRPYLSFNSPLKYQVAAMDAWLVCLFSIVLLFNLKRNQANKFSFIMLFTFSLSMLLFIGYTIPNCGALVRYKSEFTPLWLSALIGLSDLNFLRQGRRL